MGTSERTLARMDAYMHTHTRMWARIYAIWAHTREERQQPPTQRVEGDAATGFAMVL